MALNWHATPKDELYSSLSPPALGTPLSPEAAKNLALQLAWQGVGRVAPNPLVGAVIVDAQHRFLAAGAHEYVGGPHAEIQALNQLDQAIGSLSQATMYVTLEPCAHAGRTPACAMRLVQEGLRRVVYGTRDPNPLVNGQGASILQKAGIECQHDVEWDAACRQLAAVFLWNVQHKSPYIGLKAAATLDGAIARQGDKRSWITGKRAREYGHFLRVYYDAVIVGRRTVELDNPHLDARDSLGPNKRPPWKVVVDPDAQILSSVKVANLNLLKQQPERVIWLARPEAWQRPDIQAAVAACDHLGVQRPVLALGHAATSRSIPPKTILDILASLGITSALLEGGAGVYQHFLNAGLVNRLHLFQAPKLMGALGAITYNAGTEALSETLASAIDITPLDDDWVIEADFAR